MIVPLRDPQGISGVICFYFRALRKPDAAELHLLASISTQVALSLQNARLASELHEQARTDALTGLRTRAYFIELAEHEYHRARRFAKPLTVLVLNIDRFNKVNEICGRIVGDAVLQAVAQRMLKSVRLIDVISRGQADEFILVLPDCSIEGRQKVVARLYEVITSVPVETNAAHIQLGLSIGCATTTLAPDETLECVFFLAKQDMLRVKGRHRAILPPIETTILLDSC